jgi:hypothetical protein
MRLNTNGQFVVRVVRPNGGWSKGRLIAVIEDREARRPAELYVADDATHQSRSGLGRISSSKELRGS